MAFKKASDVALDPFQSDMDEATAINSEATDAALSVHTNGLDEQAIDQVKSFAELAHLMAAAGMTAVGANDAFNGGFQLVDKASMKDIPHIVMDWKFSQGRYNEDFVIVRGMTEDDRKVVYNDGSTGIRQQLKDYEKAHGKRPIHSMGLRESTYEYTDANGITGPATTWYIG